MRGREVLICITCYEIQSSLIAHVQHLALCHIQFQNILYIFKLHALAKPRLPTTEHIKTRT
jgi:hypothetical protein